MRVLTRDEQTVFINYLLTNMDECRFGVLLALLTGIRIGELCALRWGNISLKDKTIKIACTMQRLKNVDAETAAKTKIVIGSPKTENSTRIIPMSDDAAALCRKMYPKSAAAFVLTGTPDYMEPRARSNTAWNAIPKRVDCRAFIFTHSVILLLPDVSRWGLSLNLSPRFLDMLTLRSPSTAMSTRPWNSSGTI